MVPALSLRGHPEDQADPRRGVSTPGEGEKLDEDLIPPYPNDETGVNDEMMSDENEPEINWAQAAEKLGTTPWDLRTAAAIVEMQEFDKVVLDALLAVERDRGTAGWARRVIRTDDFAMGYDAETQTFWAVWAGEEVVRLPRTEVQARLMP